MRCLVHVHALPNNNADAVTTVKIPKQGCTRQEQSWLADAVHIEEQVTELVTLIIYIPRKVETWIVVLLEVLYGGGTCEANEGGYGGCKVEDQLTAILALLIPVRYWTEDQSSVDGNARMAVNWSVRTVAVNWSSTFVVMINYPPLCGNSAP